MKQIELLKTWKKELALAETFEEVKTHESAAAAAAEFAKRNKEALDKQNEIGKFRIDIERKKGAWLDQNYPQGGKNKYTKMKVEQTNLHKMPVTKDESSNARLINREEELSNQVMDEIEQKGEVITPNKVQSEIRKIIKKEAIQEERRILAEEGSKKEIEIDFRLGDFEEVFADIEDGSIDCIITDPPYPKEFLECWTKLSRFAKRVLKPNGFCIAYSGQMHLPEVMKRMNEHLDYYWTFAVYHEGQTQIVNGVNLICRWKPVLIYQNQKKKLSNTFQDYFISKHREKQGHDWQQSKSGVGYLIEMFTKPNDLILEPFAGSGTTIKAAIEKGRRIKASEIEVDTYNIAKSLL